MVTGRVESLPNIGLNIEYDDYIQLFDSKIRPKISKYLPEIISEVDRIANPAAWFKIEEIKDKNNRVIILNDEVQLNIKNIIIAFKYAKYVIPFICTIGEGIDKKLKQLSNIGNPLEMWLFDSVSSYFVEQLANKLQTIISQRFENLNPTYNFSPGYCNWEIAEQKKIFRLFENSNNNQVALNDKSCMMTPKKSISGIFGLSEKDEVETNPCNYCSEKDCPWRRA